MSLLSSNVVSAKSSSKAKIPPKFSKAHTQLGTSPKSAVDETPPIRIPRSKTPKSKTKPTSQSNNAEEPPLNNAGTTSSLGDRITENSIGNNNKPSYAFTRLDVPSGFLPPGFKDCLLSNVVRAGRRALDEFKEVRESLSNLVGEDEQLSKGIRKVNPSPEILQLSVVAEALTVLTREAFIPAHRLNQTAIALYSAEDFLRHPADSRAFDAAGSGRLKIPEVSFNAETVEKLRLVVDKATSYYSKFNLKGPSGADLQDIMFTLMRALQNLYTLFLGCQEVFKVLLYTSPRDKVNLQRFLVSLQSMERCDMLTEVQDLRRLTDELVIFLEKLSWGCFIVFRLANGKATTPKLGAEEDDAGGSSPEQLTKSKDKVPDLYPDLSFLKTDKGQNRPSTSLKGKRPSSSKKDKTPVPGVTKNEFDMLKGAKKGKPEIIKGKKKTSKGKGSASSAASLYTMTPAKSKPKSKNKSKVKFLH